jgi:hypothetical protein
MKTLKIVGIVAGIVVLGIVMLMVSAPSSSHVESSIIINASTSSVYKEANSFKNFNAWSPWAKLDPQATYVYEGPESGVGAKLSWDGPEMGKGYQEIIESVENTSVKNILAFDGFPGKYLSEMKFEAVDGGTKVTWTYDSDYSQASGMNGSFGRIMEMFMSGMIQEQFGMGLQDLKKAIEANPEPDPVTAVPDSTSVANQ